MYQHARYWAGGLDIPYFVPPVYIEALSAAGQFHVDEESYARISVSSSFLCDRDALLVILAHEACHHFLLQAGLVVTDAGRNERTTDLTMFVCGFGKLVIRGHSRASKIGGVYSTTHLGYLTTNDYVEIQRAVLEKRRAAGLLGRDDDEGSLAAPTLFKSWWHGLFGRRARRPGGSSLVEQILAETEKKRGRRGNS